MTGQGNNAQGKSKRNVLRLCNEIDVQFPNAKVGFGGLFHRSSFCRRGTLHNFLLLPRCALANLEKRW